MDLDGSGQIVRAAAFACCLAASWAWSSKLSNLTREVSRCARSSPFAASAVSRIGRPPSLPAGMVCRLDRIFLS
jgi:hypothetical protein